MKDEVPIEVSILCTEELRHRPSRPPAYEKEPRTGGECGGKAVHVVNSDQRRDHLQRLAAVRIDATTAQQSGQLSFGPTRKRTSRTAGSIRIGC